MAKGKVIRFDRFRGYGFIAPESGGEDVFLHANDLLVDENLIVPGVTVEFTLEDGGRGLKASDIRVVDGVHGVHGTVEQPDAAPARVTLPRPVSAQNGDQAARPAGDDDDGLCDVLSRAEFSNEVTELLLRTVPSITAQQILQVRAGLVQLAGNHGWVEA